MGEEGCHESTFPEGRYVIAEGGSVQKRQSLLQAPFIDSVTERLRVAQYAEGTLGATTMISTRGKLLRCLGVPAASLAIGCSAAHAGAGFGSASGGGGEDAGDASYAQDSAASTAFGSDASQLVLATADAAPAGVKFDCQPGTYAGMFGVHVTTDAGLLPALFSFNVMGTLSVTLEGHIVQPPGGGESFAQPTLTIAPGAQLVGDDATFGGHFGADLSGQLDCPSKTFTGTLSNGFYSYLGDAGGIAMTGDMSATYDDTATPPALSMGVMNLQSPQLPGVDATGSWSATLK
jgi:hypothetical protein